MIQIVIGAIGGLAAGMMLSETLEAIDGRKLARRLRMREEHERRLLHIRARRTKGD